MKTILFLVLCFLCLGAAEYTAPEGFENEDIKAWKQLEFDIFNEKQREVIIYWHGYGGYIDYATEFYKAIKRDKTHKVTFVIDGDAISSHALVVCYFPNNYIFKHGTLVFHGVFDEVTAKGKVYNDAMTNEFMDLCIANKQLTEFDRQAIVMDRQRIEVYPDGVKMYLKDWAS